MSEAAAIMDTDDNTDTDQDVETPDTDQNVEQPEEGDDGPSVEERAASMGHTSKDDWIANGGNADEWQSAETFMVLKPTLSRLKEQGRQIKNYQQQIHTLEGVYGNQVDNLRAQLSTQRDVAVEEADVAKVTAIQQQLDNLPVQSPNPQQAELSQELATWNTDPKNSWYRSDLDKQAVADARFQSYKAQNYSDAQAIQFMEADVARAFPAVNRSRENAPPVEGGSKPGRKGAAPKLTLKDLTAVEQSIWRHRPANMWKDEAEFLAMVAKTREE